MTGGEEVLMVVDKVAESLHGLSFIHDCKSCIAGNTGNRITYC